MSNKRFRQVTRVLHIVGAIVLGAFIYGPWGDGSGLELAIQVVLFPALGLSGIALWQQPRLLKLFRKQSTIRTS